VIAARSFPAISLHAALLVAAMIGTGSTKAGT
jgi:hypothetical protein